MKKLLLVILMLLISANLAFANDVDIKQLTEDALKGDAQAQVELGDCYYSGNGVSQDYKEAVKWFTLATKQNNAYGQASLAFCYENGHGVAQNNKMAYLWYLISIPHISESEDQDILSEFKNQLELKMTKEEISEAQQMASEWTKKIK